MLSEEGLSLFMIHVKSEVSCRFLWNFTKGAKSIVVFSNCLKWGGKCRLFFVMSDAGHNTMSERKKSTMNERSKNEEFSMKNHFLTQEEYTENSEKV